MVDFVWKKMYYSSDITKSAMNVVIRTGWMVDKGVSVNYVPSKIPIASVSWENNDAINEFCIIPYGRTGFQIRSIPLSGGVIAGVFGTTGWFKNLSKDELVNQLKLAILNYCETNEGKGFEKILVNMKWGMMSPFTRDWVWEDVWKFIHKDSVD